MNVNRILLVRTDRIGDIMLTLPAASILKHHFPHVFIAFLARSYTLPLVESNSNIDQIIEYKPESVHQGILGHLQLAKELKELNFDTTLLFFPNFHLAFALMRAEIPYRVGTGYRWYSFLFTNRIKEHRKDCAKHELDYNLSLLSKLIPEPLASPQFDFQIEEELVSWRDQTIKSLHIQKGYILLHIGNGTSAPNLTKKQYQLILSSLLENTKLKIILTGLADEKPIIDEMIEKYTTGRPSAGQPSAKRILNVAGQFNLKELMGIVSKAKLMIATSTGPLHIADALGIPIIAFFCPIPPHTPIRWGPYQQQEWVVQPILTTPKRCKFSQCPHGGCLQKLTDEEIILKINERLNSI